MRKLQNVAYDIAEGKMPPEVGSIIPFGYYSWRVLEIQSERALILIDKIIDKKP